jgi:hypothetical protein
MIDIAHGCAKRTYKSDFWRNRCVNHRYFLIELVASFTIARTYCNMGENACLCGWHASEACGQNNQRARACRPTSGGGVSPIFLVASFPSAARGVHPGHGAAPSPRLKTRNQLNLKYSHEEALYLAVPLRKPGLTRPGM